MRLPLTISLLLAATGCGRYGDFTLPAPTGSPANVAYRWEASPAPVLGRGPAGAWDAGDVLNPSVVRHGDAYYNFYSGFDGRSWHTGLATSRDGVLWAKEGKFLSPDRATWEGGYIAANGSALVANGEVLSWYQGGRLPRIGLARSPDGLRWRKQNAPVLEPGPYGSWDERGVADPYVIRAGGRFYLYYLGQDRARRQRLGVAMSNDGERWTKLRSNPILELGAGGAFDERGLGEPAVWSAFGHYWMLYTGRDREENRRLGLARSSNGVSWRRVVPPAVFQGAEAWNSKVLCDPTVMVEGDAVRVWFGGGDVARPDENLHGAIGVAVLRPQAW
ncbi:MAG: hypothetical protein NTY38_14700 [Acidobacteria bacterium]|nr:hypothetical protein [Acidobacteriota bacterium]